MKTFVEIGSCDFDTCYPLLENGWRGIMVEPVAEILNNVPDHKNLIKVNKVISDYNGSIKFNVTSAEEGWRHGMSVVASDNHIGENLFEYQQNAPYLKETRTLECITLDQLLDDYHVYDIDYLKIDTEGHEMNIIRAYSWRVMPSFIKLEHSHIDDVEMKRILEQLGYIVYVEQQDIYAVG